MKKTEEERKNQSWREEASQQKPQVEAAAPEQERDGDMIIGGIFTVHYYYDSHQKQLVEGVCKLPVPSFYRYMMAFMFAIDEINKNPYILPNVTLGYHVTDSCNNENKAVKNVLQILSGPENIIPNFSCLSNGKLVGVVGDQSSKTSIQIIEHLNMYGYTQGLKESFLSSRPWEPHATHTPIPIYDITKISELGIGIPIQQISADIRYLQYRNAQH
ncbi:unnamed protein product [Ranitomeya imitator]|uniref:Receptor ligand binding region domain-containing protein n=1 Tax=Ranitomeya imitator TaxID=111125 RepID=A0ABN9KZK3_9NEOB|nr:unnamed protein product [Ranitomeya imitator]